MKELWTLIRPYFTVSRVVALGTAIITPPAALVIGWLAVRLAEYGVDLDPTQTLAVFLGGVATVLTVVVPIARKWLDNRSHFEQALIENDQAYLIGSKSLQATATEAQPEPDPAYLLSQNHDVSPADANPEVDVPDEDENALERQAPEDAEQPRRSW